MPLNTYGGNLLAKQTATAGTPINCVANGDRRGRTRLTYFSYTPGGTSHTLTIMRSQGQTSLVASALASQAVLSLLADPGAGVSNALAANDWLVWRNDDGTFGIGKVSSVAAGAGTQILVTLTANLTKAITVGADVWDFGVAADIDPLTGLANPQFALPTGSTTALPSDGTSIASGHGPNQPLLCQVDNITAAGTMNQMNWAQSLT